ncbi:hypothetical protein [Nonomuraea sp. KM88]|uniref:hypothetical protein n=1 Tax=Nonomuraea sp. KM88 TaxID=3457427 RepID=UPI003FCCD29E
MERGAQARGLRRGVQHVALPGSEDRLDRRSSARLIFFSWVGAGFLVPMLPYTVISGVLGVLEADPGGGDGIASAAREDTVFLTIGFTGMAVGLAVALPIYLRERWPRAFLGHVEDGPSRSSGLVTAAVVVAAGLGLLWSSWALGGTLGLDPAHREHGDLQGRLLNASAGLWALLGAWSIWAIIRRRPARLRRWVPVTLAFGASGSMFAWSGWKLPMVILRPGGFVTAEYTMLAIVQHSLSIGVGLIFMAVVLRAARREDAAPPGSAAALE